MSGSMIENESAKEGRKKKNIGQRVNPHKLIGSISKITHVWFLFVPSLPSLLLSCLLSNPRCCSFVQGTPVEARWPKGSRRR